MLNKNDKSTSLTSFKVTSREAGRRADQVVRRLFPDVPLSALYRYFRKKRILNNGKRCQPQAVLAATDLLEFKFRFQDEPVVAAKLTGSQVGRILERRVFRDVAILDQDPALLVFNKPPGLCVQGGTGVPQNRTLFAYAKAYLSSEGDTDPEVHLVHRLDKDTSGVLVLARNLEASRALDEQFRKGTTVKKYLAMVKGRPRPSKGIFDSLIEVKPKTGQSKMVRKEAVTEYRVIKKVGDIGTLVEVIPRTGRFHQIRIHFAQAGCPVAGDSRHGDFEWNRELKRRFGLRRLFLHAESLEICHPLTNKRRKYSVKLAADLNAIFARV